MFLTYPSSSISTYSTLLSPKTKVTLFFCVLLFVSPPPSSICSQTALKTVFLIIGVILGSGDQPINLYPSFLGI